MTADKTRKKLPTTDRKNINQLPTDDGPTLSTFVFRKKRSEEHFVFFVAYEVLVTLLKVTIEFPVILLFGWRKAQSHFAEQLLVLEPMKPRTVIFQLCCLFTVSHEWNHKSVIWGQQAYTTQSTWSGSFCLRYNFVPMSMSLSECPFLFDNYYGQFFESFI